VYIYVMFLYCKVKTLKHNNTKVFRGDKYKGSKHKRQNLTYGLEMAAGGRVV
jgi:hypothetical protein